MDGIDGENDRWFVHDLTGMSTNSCVAISTPGRLWPARIFLLTLGASFGTVLDEAFGSSRFIVVLWNLSFYFSVSVRLLVIVVVVVELFFPIWTWLQLTLGLDEDRWSFREVVEVGGGAKGQNAGAALARDRGSSNPTRAVRLRIPLKVEEGRIWSSKDDLLQVLLVFPPGERDGQDFNQR